MSGTIIYLACPYTDPSFEVRTFRFEAATKAAATLIKRGRIVFSPVTMTHPLDAVLAGSQNTLGTEFWTSFDEAFMEFCGEMIILRLDGWRESAGIRREQAFFESKGRAISFMDP